VGARWLFVAAVVLSPLAGGSGAEAHGGGLDGTGGHHCRQAGYESGKCSPLNSYHCHQSPCGSQAPATTTEPAPPATTAAPPPPTTAVPTTIATTTTSTTVPVPTTTTTTAVATSTSTSESTTTTAVVFPKADPASSSRADAEEELSALDYVVTLAFLGGVGFGGYRLATRRARRRRARGTAN
jgi:hypothetical protein